jgi:hypothetical protein
MMTQQAKCGSVSNRDAETTDPACLPLVASFPPNCIAHPLQNLPVEVTSIFLSGRYELMVHETVDVGEFRELFDYSSLFNLVPSSGIRKM